MRTVYACTHVEKTALPWLKGYPDDPDGVSRVLSEDLNVTAPTTEKLVLFLGHQFFIDMTGLVAGGGLGGVGTLSHSCVENIASKPPTRKEWLDWKRGALKLYKCVYTFEVEKREVSDVPAADFAAWGVRLKWEEN